MSPEQIAGKRFVVALRGYDRDEVDAFLKEVADEVAGLLSGEPPGGEQPGHAAPVEAPSGGLEHFAEEIDTLIRSAVRVAGDIRARAEQAAAHMLETAERQVTDRQRQAADAIANERSEWEAEREHQTQALQRARAQAEEELAKAAQIRQAAEEMNDQVERDAAAMRETLEQSSAWLQEQDARSAETQAAAGQQLAEATAVREAAEREAAALIVKAKEEAAGLRQQVRERLQQSIDALNAMSMSVPGSEEEGSAPSDENTAHPTGDEAGG